MFKYNIGDKFIDGDEIVVIYSQNIDDMDGHDYDCTAHKDGKFTCWFGLREEDIDKLERIEDIESALEL